MTFSVTLETIVKGTWSTVEDSVSGLSLVPDGPPVILVDGVSPEQFIRNQFEDAGLDTPSDSTIADMRNEFLGEGSEFGPVTFAYVMETGDTIRVRLQNEKGNDAGRVRLYRKGTDGEYDSLVEGSDFKTVREGITEGHPFMNSVEITDVPTGSGPGEIWKLKLSEHDSDGPSGNNWVRFSRNVPPYFSNDPDRLIYPIVHKEFKPITYCSVPGPPPKRQTYRTYLTVPRGTGSPIPLTGELKINVNGTRASAVVPNYIAEVGVVIPQGAATVEGDNLQAQVVDTNGDLLADSTDKVDKVYWVNNPDFTGWPSQIVMAYDNGNGRNRTADLHGAGFNTIQTDKDDTLDIISENNMSSAGAMYTHEVGGSSAIKAWYCESRDNAMSDKIRFWMMLDEPDALSGEVAKTLKELYDVYYKYNTYANKPYSFNISNPIYIEEFCEACDVIIADPFVYKKPPEGEKGRGKYNQNRISDTATEMKYVAGSEKKTILIFWWWNPADPSSIADPTVYGLSWDKGIDAEVSGLGGFNFSETLSGGDVNALSTYGQPEGPVPDLWKEVKCKINPDLPECQPPPPSS